MTSSILEPVSIKAVAMIDRLPPPSIFLAAPKNLFGFWRAFASTPPVSILPEAAWVELYALAKRVIESSNITTSCLCSTNLRALLIAISATWTCLVGASSKVLAITSPLTERFISVTSSGLSSTKRTIILHSGLFLSIEWAILWSNRVLPAFGGETIRDLWPLPVGAVRSITLEERSSVLPVPNSKSILWSGKSGVRFSKEGLFFVLSGSS